MDHNALFCGSCEMLIKMIFYWQYGKMFEWNGVFVGVHVFFFVFFFVRGLTCVGDFMSRYLNFTQGHGLMFLPQKGLLILILAFCTVYLKD